MTNAIIRAFVALRVSAGTKSGMPACDSRRLRSGLQQTAGLLPLVGCVIAQSIAATRSDQRASNTSSSTAYGSHINATTAPDHITSDAKGGG
jgi:hypothetical protein